MLMIFIIITIILFILSVFIMDDNPILAIPIIFAGMVFTILCSYGFFNVDTVYMGQNTTTGNIEPMIYQNPEYGEMYPWIFFFVFILFVILFIRVCFNIWVEAHQTPGEMNYNNHRR